MVLQSVYPYSPEIVLSMVANVLAREPAMLIDNHDAANRTGRGSISALPRPPEYHLSYWEDAANQLQSAVNE